MFLHLLGAFALTCCFGGSVSSFDISLQNNENIEFHLDNKLNVSYDDENYQITLTADELNNYTFSHLFNDDDIYSLDEFTFEIDQTTFTYADTLTWNESDSFYYIFDNTNNLTFIFSNDYSSWLVAQGYSGLNLIPYHFYLIQEVNGNGQIVLFDNQLNLINFNPQSNYALVKQAIELDIQANQPVPPTQIMGDFVSILVSGIVQLGSGLAAGIVSMASALFLVTDAGGNVTGLSMFGGLIALFAGLALAVGITTKVYQWVTSLGN